MKHVLLDFPTPSTPRWCKRADSRKKKKNMQVNVVGLIFLDCVVDGFV